LKEGAFPVVAPDAEDAFGDILDGVVRRIASLDRPADGKNKGRDQKKEKGNPC
jgi:hypothetical protein